MTEQFQFDTSGEVLLTQPGWLCSIAKTWPDLSPGVQGCIAAMLEEVNADDTLMGSWLFHHAADRKPGFSDLHRDTVARIIADWEAMQMQMQIAGPAFCETAELGQVAWTERQAGRWADFPPLTRYLNEGKVCLREPA